MTGLVRRALSTIKGWWSRASTTVLSLVRGVARVVRTVAVRVVGYAATVLAAIRDRHRERLARDAGYRSVVASAVSAVLVTVIPQPAVAAALAVLAVLVSEHLGSPRPAAEQSACSYDSDEDGGYEAYDVRRAWSSTSSRPPQRLWDRYTD